MLSVERSNQFKRDYKKAAKRGKRLDRLQEQDIAEKGADVETFAARRH